MSDPPGRTTVTTTAPRPRAVQAAPQTDGRPSRWRRSRARQARVVIRKVRPWSVLKVSFFFYLCVWAVILGALVILYGVLGAIGAIDSVEKLAGEIFAEKGTFQIHGDWLFQRAVVVAFAMVILWTLINVFVTMLYNLISDVVGGIEVTLSERR